MPRTPAVNTELAVYGPMGLCTANLRKLSAPPLFAGFTELNDEDFPRRPSKVCFRRAHVQSSPTKAPQVLVAHLL
jgi:hypothetical protein